MGLATRMLYIHVLDILLKHEIYEMKLTLQLNRINLCHKLILFIADTRGEKNYVRKMEDFYHTRKACVSTSFRLLHL